MKYLKTSVDGLVIRTDTNTYYVKKMINGKNIRKSLNTDSLPLAKERLREILANSETYRSKKSGKLYKLIDDYIIYCMEYRKLSNNTMKTRIPRLNKLKRFFGDVLIDSIKTKTYIEFKQISISMNLSKVTINNDMKVHSAFFEWCCRNPDPDKPYLFKNPIKAVEKYRINPRTRKALPFDIVLEFIESIKDKNLRIYQISKLILYTGMRIGEVLNLSFNDIDYDDNKVIVRNGKWDIDRSIPLSPVVIEVLKSLPKFKKEFYRRPGNSNREIKVDNSKNLLFPELTYYSISSKMKMIIDVYTSKNKLEIEFGFHVFRHTFASELLRKDVPVGVISEILGHKNIKTTMIYLDVQSVEKINAIKIL